MSKTRQLALKPRPRARALRRTERLTLIPDAASPPRGASPAAAVKADRSGRDELDNTRPRPCLAQPVLRRGRMRTTGATGLLTGADVRKANWVITAILTLVALAGWARVFWNLFGIGPGNIPASVTEAYWTIAISFSVFACVGWVLVSGRRKEWDGTTRCRACGYRLQGISEPRCPECGAHI